MRPLLINKLVDSGQRFYDEREERIRAQVKDEATFGTKTIAGKVFDKLSRRLKKTFSEIRSDSKIRQEFDRRIKLLAWEFENDSKTKERTEAYKQEFLNDPQVKEAFSSIGSALKNRFVHNLTETKDSDPPLAKDITKLLDRLGDMLSTDPFIRQMVNERLKAAVPSFVERYRDSLSSVISTRVKKWKAKEMSAQIELHIGRDLQFIRINGTIVGGLVGLIIYILSQLSF